MAKELFKLPLGPMGEIALTVAGGAIVVAGNYTDKGYVKLEAGYPLELLLEPVKTHFIDKLKSIIPGDLDDKVIDAAWAKALAALSEKA